MLRTITELVPFGRDDAAKPISVFYIANIGKTTTYSDTYSYVLGYYETASAFSKGERKFKVLDFWNRNRPYSEMLSAFFSDELHWMPSTQYSKVDKIFDKRAKDDIGWEEQ